MGRRRGGRRRRGAAAVAVAPRVQIARRCVPRQQPPIAGANDRHLAVRRQRSGDKRRAAPRSDAVDAYKCACLNDHDALLARARHSRDVAPNVGRRCPQTFDAAPHLQRLEAAVFVANVSAPVDKLVGRVDGPQLIRIRSLQKGNEGCRVGDRLHKAAAGGVAGKAHRKATIRAFVVTSKRCAEALPATKGIRGGVII